MGRYSCCFKQKLRKGLWSPEEDEKLLRHITKYGHGCWSSVPKQAGLQRCGKSCRLRWINYLRPDLKRGMFSEEEENLILELHKILGNRWSQIAAQLPGRTDNEIKNLWNSSLKKKLRQRGIDPMTHKPLSGVENGGEATIINPIDTASGIYNEMNILHVNNSKPCDDSMGYFPLQQSNYASNNNITSMSESSNLWFSQPGLDNSIFSWGMSNCSTSSEKGLEIPIGESVPEIYENPFLMEAGTFQNHNPQHFYNEVKTESQFDSRNISGSIWPYHNQQKHEPLQTLSQQYTDTFS